MDLTSRARLKTLGIWAWTLLPLIFLIASVVRYHVDVPYGDQWSLVPFVEKSYQGTLTLHDFFVPFGDHLIPLPKLWMLALIRLSSWNLLYELFGNIALAAGLFFVLRHQLTLTFRSAGAPQPAWLLPILSTLIFSLRPLGNWFFGYHVPLFLNILPAVLGLFLLARPRLSWARLSASLVLGVAATLSFANGILYWPVGLWILWTSAGRQANRTRWTWTWSLLGGGLVLALVPTYFRSRNLPFSGFGPRHPFEFLWYVLAYLGNPILSLRSVACAALAGASGIGLLIWTGWRLRAVEKLPRETLLPYLAIAFYALGTACLTGIGRVGRGPAHALFSNYILMANLLWVTVLVFLALLMARNPSERRFAIPWVVGIALIVTLSSIRSQTNFRLLHEKISQGRAELFRLEDDSKLQILLYSRPDLVRKWTPILQKRRLSVFRNLTT